jgi:hypothetical protein
MGRGGRSAVYYRFSVDLLYQCNGYLVNDGYDPPGEIFTAETLVYTQEIWNSVA